MRFFANRSNDLPDFIAYFPKVHAIDNFTGNIVAFCAIDDLFERCGTLHGCAHGEEVILANENDWQFVERGEIERFMKCTLIDRAVTEETKSDAILIPIFTGKGEAAGERHMRTDNGVSAMHIVFAIKKVHG